MSSSHEVRLKDVLSLSSSGHKPSGDIHYYVGLEHIEKNTGRILPEAKEEVITTVKNKFVSGEILYGKLRPNLNKVAMAHRDGVCSTDILVLRPSTRLDVRYLYHFMLSSKFVRDMSANTSGANLPRVSSRFLLDYTIPLPPFGEQTRIADTLDKADALRRKDQELLLKYDELAQSIFYEMFGDPLGNSDNKVPLSSVVEINPSKREARVSTDTPVSFLPMACVGEDGSLELSQVRQFSEVSTGFTYFREDDVLFAKITPCMENGKGAIARGLLNGIGFGSTEFHVLRPTKRTTSEFIYTLLHLTNVRKEAAKNMTGSGGQQRVPRSFFDALCITVPPVELQKDFSERLSVVRALRARTLSGIASSTTLFDSLLSKYFA